MLIIRVLSSLSPSRFPHYHLFHRPHPLATGTRVAGTAVPNGPGAAFQPPGNWEEEVLGAWIHVAWLWPYCRYVNLGHRYFILLCNRWKCGKGEGCPITAGSVIDSELILQVSNHWWKLCAKLQVDIRMEVPDASGDCTSQWCPCTQYDTIAHRSGNCYDPLHLRYALLLWADLNHI